MAEKHAEGKHGGGGGHKKAKKHEEGLKVDAPMWMMSWADMVTLLMALFVAMYSISTLDVVKFQKFIEGLRGVQLSDRKTPSALKQLEEGKIFPVNPSEEEIVRGEGKERGDTDTRALTEGQYRRHDSPRIGQPSVGETIRFEPGSATLTSAGRERLRRFANEVKGYESKIEIRGHCTQGESETPRNLSYARCMAAYDYLTGYGSIPDRRLKVTAMGTADPLNPDQSEFEKMGNRRVEVTETPEYSKEVSSR